MPTPDWDIPNYSTTQTHIIFKSLLQYLDNIEKPFHQEVTLRRYDNQYNVHIVYYKMSGSQNTIYRKCADLMKKKPKTTGKFLITTFASKVAKFRQRTIDLPSA